ncbi:hypothetical protein G6F32_016954 [Rhizopus arrhizus]|nr:hypothetical protein G6F32_016954 [Rhizopus arrhizus]
MNASDREAVLVFQDSTGQQTDLDLRGDDAQIAARHAPPPAADLPAVEPDAVDAADAQPRGRGRPASGMQAMVLAVPIVMQVP